MASKVQGKQPTPANPKSTASTPKKKAAPASSGKGKAKAKAEEIEESEELKEWEETE